MKPESVRKVHALLLLLTLFLLVLAGDFGRTAAAQQPAPPPTPAASPEFDTIQDTGEVPPDSAIAASELAMLCMANSAIQVRSLNGDLLASSSLKQLFGIPEPQLPVVKYRFKHPRLAYDPVAKRFLFEVMFLITVRVADVNGQPVDVDVSTAIFMVSKSPNPADGWNPYVFAVYRTKFPPALPLSLPALREIVTGQIPEEWKAAEGLPTELADLPALGWDGRAIYLTFDMVTSKVGNFSGNMTLILDKAKAYNGEKLETPVMLHDLLVPKPAVPGAPAADVAASTLKPVEGYPAAGSTPGLLLSYHPLAGVILYRIANPLSNPVVTASVVGSRGLLPPLPSSQAGSTNLLPSGDTGLQEAVYRNGVVWTCHAVANALSTANPVPGSGQVVVYKINPAGAGTLADVEALASPTLQYSYPSVMPDNYGGAVVVFQASGPQAFPSIYHARYDRKSLAFMPPVVTDASATTYEYQDANHTTYWGAYTDAALDPATGTRVWIQGELTATHTTWRLRAGRVEASPPPIAPTRLTATAIYPARVRLQWVDNSRDETRFVIERKVGAAGTWSVLGNAAANVSAYVDSRTAAGNTYLYRVRADAGGLYSTYSNEASAAIPALPAAPSNLTATAVYPGRVQLRWVDNSTNESLMVVERKAGATGTWSTLANARANTTSYLDTRTTRGTSYTYRVRSYNVAAYSAYSNEAGAGIPSAPAAPMGLTAAALSATQVQLRWTDMSNNETLMVVERKVGATGTWSTLANARANTTSYVDTRCTGGVTYFYRVRSYNVAAYSGYSNQVSATTPRN